MTFHVVPATGAAADQAQPVPGAFTVVVTALAGELLAATCLGSLLVA